MASFYVLTTRAVAAGGLHADLGIQYYLARATAGGAVPLVDFEHGWNTAHWYLSALMYQVAGGNATGWLFLWGRSGLLMGAAAVLIIAWRRRLPAVWLAALVPTWMLLTAIPHNKYATATVWVAILLPVWGQRTSTGRALRVGGAATVWWFHVELAVLLAIGTAIYDLFGAEGGWAARLRTAAHAPIGLVIGAATQVAVYAGPGLPAGEVLSQIVSDSAVTEVGPLFGYPLLEPNTIRMAVYPASLLLPFVPLVWRRLSGDTRLIACCHLALALIAIRRPGDGHVGSAGTLLALLLVLTARDLSGSDLAARVRGVRPSPAVLITGLGGATWYAVGLGAGFRVESLVAIVALVLTALASVVTADRLAPREVALSLGAVAAAVALVVGGAANHLRLTIGADDALRETVAIAEAVRADIDACVGSAREAWVVTSPLTLYDELALTNPTRIVAFWYNLENQADELAETMRAGEIPAIVQVTSWPAAMAPLVPVIEAEFEVCAETPVPAVNRRVTIWRWVGP